MFEYIMLVFIVGLVIFCVWCSNSISNDCVELHVRMKQIDKELRNKKATNKTE